MYFDSGRLADLRQLEQKLKESTTQIERNKYQSLIGDLKRQAEHPALNKAREQLLEMRRRAGTAKGEANIKYYRDEADKLERRVDKEIRL